VVAGSEAATGSTREDEPNTNTNPEHGPIAVTDVHGLWIVIAYGESAGNVGAQHITDEGSESDKKRDTE
jgi:hypothetical protein